jgi:hypothetical protein
MEITNTQNDDFLSRTSRKSDCDKVMAILDKMIEGYATYEDEVFFGNHAEDCPPCFDGLEKQRLFIQFLNKTIQLKGAPASLIDSIKANISKTV